jgi:hypothetical protein
LGKSQAPEQLFTQQFLADGYELLFAGLGLVAGSFSPGTSQDHWKLDPSESADLGKKTRKWLDTIDHKRLEQLEKKYGKYIPGGQLVVALGMLTIPRVVQSIDSHKKKGAPARVDVRPQAAPTATTAEPRRPVSVSDYGSNGAAPAPAPSSGADDATSLAARASAGRFDPTEPEPDAGGDGALRPFRGADGGAFGLFDDA